MSIKIICGHSIFNENAIVMSQKYKWEIEKDFNPKKNDLYVVLGSHEISHQLLEAQFRSNMSFGYVILNSEQINSQFFKNKYYLELMKRNVVCDYNSLTADWLKENHKIKVFSYFYFEFMKFNLETNRDYDLVFVGTPNEKRVALYNKIKETYPELNIYFDFEWKHSSPEKLTELLHKTKVVLNMPFYDNNALETHRINKAKACGCEVISLHSCENDADEFYKDYVYFCDDIMEGLEKYFKGLPKKRSYEELVKGLSQKISPHLLFVINQVHKKLISLSITDDSASEIVSEQTATDSAVQSNTQTEICA